ncbi:MAG TPA: hypothetical protein VK034_05225 [Enhygromyxa sp.]|nr:hypothetical protein [Enhygromyxa sp.]
MDFPIKLVLPAALVVTTFASAGACQEHTPRHCGDIVTKLKCNSEPGCEWNQQDHDCQSVCFQIEDQQQCEDIERCIWDPSGGTSDGEETDGDPGICTEPFT